MAGGERTEEIRLFGLIGEPVRVTLGREQGPPHRTVTLRSPTVSRRHARLDFADGVWRIRNLSRTNPVVVNDRTLDDPAATLALADGDRIELGEVVLQFVGR
jgi:pSer/pThr/pTyr-binding forkhead associated (FHA) protein